MRRRAQGRATVARQVVSHFRSVQAPAPEIATLTPREHEILHLLADGLHYKEIADKLGIKTRTVGVHLPTMSLIVRQSQEVHAMLRGTLYGNGLKQASPAPKP